MNQDTNTAVRVRFAPSPTGGLHLGGVRTVLFNYLFAKKMGGKFILRIEDTDSTRFVPGAEEYIFECLDWCGLTPDESPIHGGPFGPYRQSERKDIYRPYAEKLVEMGKAYYAFDTPEDLEKMRTDYKSEENPSPQYNHLLRSKMKNSLTLPKEEVQQLLEKGTPHVIRILMPENESVSFQDMIRGEVSFQTSNVDDKVLLKADGMPTYHLAVVVDDYLMKITHAFRGEEWLPSAPVHLLLWDYLGWKDSMPQWAHLPLILKPDGNGKLSKRDGDRLGFPVYAMNWTDPQLQTTTEGFRERGFLPEAFINMLALIGWNDGTGQELFTLSELIEKFSISRVHKGGAKFDFEKAKWFNNQYLQKTNNKELATLFLPLLHKKGIDHRVSFQPNTSLLDYATKVIGLIKDRCSFVNECWEQGHYFFQEPDWMDLSPISAKWNEEKLQFFQEWINVIQAFSDSSPSESLAPQLEESFKNLAAAKNLKMGEVQLPLRIMLVGGKFGPAVFDIAATIGIPETIRRIQTVVEKL